MSKQLALLRGINVGGQRRVKMAELRAFFAERGATQVDSYLQSGNIVYAGPGFQVTELETALHQHFDLEIGVLLPPSELVAQLIVAQPFAEAVLEDPRRVHVFFLSGTPASVEPLLPYCTAQERMQIFSSALVVDYPALSARSKLTLAQIEKNLKLKGSARNWRTVLKLHEMLRV